jgi:hypothetical protein
MENVTRRSDSLTPASNESHFWTRFYDWELLDQFCVKPFVIGIQERDEFGACLLNSDISRRRIRRDLSPAGLGEGWRNPTLEHGCRYRRCCHHLRR